MSAESKKMKKETKPTDQYTGCIRWRPMGGWSNGGGKSLEKGERSDLEDRGRERKREERLERQMCAYRNGSWEWETGRSGCGGCGG